MLLVELQQSAHTLNLLFMGFMGKYGFIVDLPLNATIYSSTASHRDGLNNPLNLLFKWSYHRSNLKSLSKLPEKVLKALHRHYFRNPINPEV